MLMISDGNWSKMNQVGKVCWVEEIKDHCLTLKHAPHLILSCVAYETLVNEEEPTCSTPDTPHRTNPMRRIGQTQPLPRNQVEIRSLMKKSRLQVDTWRCFRILAIKSSSGLRFRWFKRPRKEKKEIYLYLKEMRRIWSLDAPYWEMRRIWSLDAPYWVSFRLGGYVYL